MAETVEFVFKGHSCVLICPDNPAQGRPWLWRTEFLYAFNDADNALLHRGYHIAYCGFSDEYGSDEAVALFREFFDFIVKEYSLAPKASLFGFSRGGLYALNYALAHPNDVTCLYLDAPVVDLRSWPGGLGKGCGSPSEWEDCKKRVLGVHSDEEAGRHRTNPVNRLDEICATGIPVLIVAGDSDRVVPYEENGLLLAQALERNGREARVIIKAGCDHHPHGLADVTPVVNFMEANS